MDTYESRWAEFCKARIASHLAQAAAYEAEARAERLNPHHVNPDRIAHLIAIAADYRKMADDLKAELTTTEINA